MIDRRPVISGAFFTCLGTSCVADYEATPEVVGMLKSGKTLLIQAISLSAKAINFSMPLADNSRNSFGKVNEGAAVDAGEPELQRERLRDYIQFAHRSPSKAPFGQRDRGSAKITAPTRDRNQQRGAANGPPTDLVMFADTPGRPYPVRIERRIASGNPRK